MVVGSIISAVAGNSAAKAQVNAADRATDVQRQNFLDSVELIQPQIQAGDRARSALEFELGLADRPTFQPEAPEVTAPQNALSVQVVPGGTSRELINPNVNEQDREYRTIQNADSFLVGDISFSDRGSADNYLAQKQAELEQAQQDAAGGFEYQGFEATPGYQFRLDEGQKAVERAAAASGRMNSGATIKAATRYGQGVAAQEYDNYLNRLSALSGSGQVATGQQVSLGQSNANAISQLQLQRGDAQASSYNALGNAANNAFNNVVGGASAFGLF